MTIQPFLIWLIFAGIVEGFPQNVNPEREPLMPLKFKRSDVAADHQKIQEGQFYNLESTEPPVHFQLPVHNRRMLKVSNILNLEPIEQAETVQKIKERIFSSNPKFNDKSELNMRELKLLENGIWVRCFWLKPLPPPLSDDDQCSVKELQDLIDKL